MRHQSRGHLGLGMFGQDMSKACARGMKDPAYRRFHCSVQCQNVGLERNRVDDRDDVRDLLRAVVDRGHRVDDLTDHCAPFHRHFRGPHRVCCKDNSDCRA